MASFQLVCCSVLCLIILMQSTQRTVTGYEFFWSDCPADANYTANSPYESNFNLLLSSLSTAAVDTGYYNGSAGAEPNKVYGLAQCRGDQSAAECRSCLSTAAQDIVQKCPMGQNSAIFYEECFLRYSNSSFFYPANSVRNYYIYLCNPQNASNTQVFDDLLGSMMDDLSTRASNSPRKYAGGVATYMSFTNLYGLAQCTRDLSQAACYRCIQDLRGRIPQYCPQRKGGRIYLFDCYIRYELYQFYNNVSTDNPAMPPSLPPRPSPSQESTTTIGNKKFSTGKVLALSISIAVALLVLLLIALFHCRQRTKPDPPGDFPNIRSSEYIIFNFTTLKSATNNFANKLGEGGFGPVYKGMLEDGEQVAVKRLSINSGQGLAEFKTEVALVARLQHRNLVRLLGCCFQEQEKILVYEYLPNTSLDNILFYPSRRSELNWGNRLNIIEGIARGLQYLHEDSRLKIVHRDLKASNILLDANMNPKISDFGLAKLINIDETHRNTSRIAGTYKQLIGDSGYMPPEYAMHGNFSVKTDVFSYGVLVLEIVTGRRNSGCDVYSNGSSANLLSYVWQHWNEGSALEVVDQTLTNQYNAEEALRCIHIGLLCIHEDPTYRPSMASVVLMLSSYSLSLPNPSPPAFVFHIGSSHKSDFFHFGGAQGKKKSSEGSTSSVTSREIPEDDPIIA